MTSSRPKKQVTFGLFDTEKLEKIFRKAAFCRALASKIRVKEVRGWIADFEEVDMPAPIQTRNETAAIYSDNFQEFDELSKAGETLALRDFYESILQQFYRDHDKIRETFKGVDRYNAKILTRLMVAQYTTATVGMGAGLGLIVLGGSASLVMLGSTITGATGATTVFGVSTGSSLQLGATVIGTNILVSSARDWSNCESWSGVAYAGANQALTDSVRTGVNEGAEAGFNKWWASCVGTAPTLGGKITNFFKRVGVRGIQGGTGTVLAVAFAGVDVRNEVNQYLRSIESPQQRQRQVAKKKRIR